MSTTIDRRQELAAKESRASKEEIDTLKTLFDKHDTNHDGKLDKNELKILMKTFNEEMTMADIEDMIKQADWDEDGHIDWEEVCVYFIRMVYSNYCFE